MVGDGGTHERCSPSRRTSLGKTTSCVAITRAAAAEKVAESCGCAYPNMADPKRQYVETHSVSDQPIASATAQSASCVNAPFDCTRAASGRRS